MCSYRTSIHADSHDFYLRVHHRNVCRNVTDRLFHQPAYAFRPCACHRHGGDDAIVVVEAVQAKFDEGYQSPVLAADDAMKGVSSAILTSTLIFMAVFFPVGMMGGTSGAFYTQFGITMAVAVGISAINAFTLSPALCALLLKPYIDEHGNTKNNFAARFRKAFNAVLTV